MASRKRLKSDHCPNCGEILYQANYCPNCGQENDRRRISFWQLIGDTLSNYLAFDGRLFRTLAGVILRPGQVANEYREGKRQRHMPPIRFYFLASLLLVFVLQMQRPDPQIDVGGPANNNAATSQETQDDQVTALQSLRKEAQQNQLSSWHRIEIYSDYFKVDRQAQPEDMLKDLDQENSFWNEFLADQAWKISRLKSGQEAAEAFNRSFMNGLFWILFFFIPVLGFLLKLLYIRRDVYYTEHLFFTFYQQAFFFLLLFIYFISGLETQFLFYVFALYALHLLIALKGFYRQSLLKTIIKFILLNLLTLLAFGLFFVMAALVVFLLL